MRVSTYVVLLALIVASCGGNYSANLSNSQIPNGVQSQTGDLPKIAYAGSPVRKSRSYINLGAIEPGESWLNMNDPVGLSLGGGHTLKGFESQRIIPDLDFSYGPGIEPDAELEAQVRRAFKLWTRYLTGIHGSDERLWPIIVEVGHSRACGGGANTLACVWPVGSTGNPHDVPLMQIPASQAALVAKANSPITLLSTLAHEAGHALDYSHLIGYINPETGILETWHAPRWTGQLMAPLSGDSETIGPQIMDLLGVGHTFSYGGALSPDLFGWWMDGPETSALRAFGSMVTRSFGITELAGITGDVTADSNSVTADTITSDFVKVSSFVDGNPTHPSWLNDVTLPNHLDLGNATWSGALLAIDTTDYAPVFGIANLDMNLAAIVLSATFSDFKKGPDFLPWGGSDSLNYSMTMNSDGVWHDALGRVDARFFAGNNAAGVIDPAYTAAGHLDDHEAKILGAYGAVRQSSE